jgi:hypothetical protein
MNQKNKQPQQGRHDENKDQTSKDQTGKHTPDMDKTASKHDPHKTAKHPEASDAGNDKAAEDDFTPEKSTEIGDDPNETKKKIPNMHK